MKWNVFSQDSKTGKFKSYNIFEYPDFRISMENLFKRQYPQERFLSEIDQEIHHYFRAKIEWEMFITAWPPHINSEEISRIISEYFINRSPKQPLPEQILRQPCIKKYQDTRLPNEVNHTSTNPTKL